jgi:hypothetical protein
VLDFGRCLWAALGGKIESLPLWVQWLTAIATLATPIAVVVAFYRRENREKSIEAFYAEMLDFCDKYPWGYTGNAYKMFPVGSKQIGYAEELVRRERLIRIQLGREYGYRLPQPHGKVRSGTNSNDSYIRSN